MAEQKFYGVKASRGIVCDKVLLYEPKELTVSAQPVANTDKDYT